MQKLHWHLGLRYWKIFDILEKTATTSTWLPCQWSVGIRFAYITSAHYFPRKYHLSKVFMCVISSVSTGKRIRQENDLNLVWLSSLGHNMLPLPLNSMIKTELFRQHQVNPSEEFFQIYLILKHIWPNNAYCRFEFHSDHYLPLLDNIIISTIFTLKKLYLE